MENWQLIILALYAPIVIIALARIPVFLLAYHKLRFLTANSPRCPVENAPLVSILVPAKDEERSIETCVRALLQQDYPRFELLVVDDRSADRTAEIVAHIATEDSRLRLLRVSELPPGWTGKTHALHFGQQQAKGEWLLFVDADAWLDPCCLSAALHDAIDHHIDLESLLPALRTESFWERVIQPFAAVCLMMLFPLTKVNRPHHKTMGFANGQFILIRRSAYEAIGGHEGVRDKFVEDIHLGRRTRAQGLGLRVVLAPEIFAVRMYASLQEIIRGWSRILYSSVDQHPLKLYGIFISIILFSVVSYAVLTVGGTLLLLGYQCPFLWSLVTMGIVHQAAQTLVMNWLYEVSRSSRWYLLARPLAVAMMLYIVARTIRMCSTHQVIWRGTAYGKDLLSKP